MLFEVAKGKAGLQEALTHLCKMAEESVTEGVNYIVLTDRECGYYPCCHSIIAGSKRRSSPSDFCR